MTHPTPDSQIIPRLDEETERVIDDYAYADFLSHVSAPEAFSEAREKADSALVVLRSRIRELQEQAFQRGRESK